MHPHRRLLSVAIVSAVAVAMVLAGLMAAVGPASANHDTVMWSRYMRYSFDDLAQVYSTTFTDGKGHLFLFYYEINTNNGDTNITMLRFITNGVGGLPEFEFERQVNPTLPAVLAYPSNFFGVESPPSVAMDHTGNLYVAWANENYDVYVSKSADGGNSWGAPSRVDATSANSFDTGPEITATPDGALYVAWLNFWFPAGYHNITVAKSTDAGATWSGRTNITAFGSRTLLSHAIASDSLGRVYVAYSSYLGGLVGSVNLTWSDTGATWAAPTVVNGATLGVFPDVAVDSQDRLHVVWADYRVSPNGFVTLWYRRSNDRGASWNVEFPVSQGNLFATFYPPNVAVHGDTVMVSWPSAPPSFGTFGFAYSVSVDAGDLWYPEAFAESGADDLEWPSLAADENGTFYAASSMYDFFDDEYEMGFQMWDGPPSAPTITSIARGSDNLTVSWSPSPEGDVTGYRLWRSVDGLTYELVATVDASTTSYIDGGLANGTYWYRVTSFDVRGTSSHPSTAMSATVGQTTAEMIADLEAQLAATQAQIAQLQADLANAQTDIDDLQGRLSQLQTDLTSLQNDLDANDAATQQRLNDLENQLDSLQNQLNQMRTEVATQTMSYVNMLLVILVLALVAYLLVQQMRMRKMPPSRPEANPPPQQSMQPPPQAPRPPEDDL